MNTTNDKKVDYSNIFLQFWLECISMNIFIQYFPLIKTVLLRMYEKEVLLEEGNDGACKLQYSEWKRHLLAKGHESRN